MDLLIWKRFLLDSFRYSSSFWNYNLLSDLTKFQKNTRLSLREAHAFSKSSLNRVCVGFGILKITLLELNINKNYKSTSTIKARNFMSHFFGTTWSYYSIHSPSRTMYRLQSRSSNFSIPLLYIRMHFHWFQAECIGRYLARSVPTLRRAFPYRNTPERYVQH